MGESELTHIIMPKADDDDSTSAPLLGNSPRQQGQPTRLVEEFERRKQLRDERGIDPDTDMDMGSFFKLAREMRDRQGFKLKIQRELSHDDAIKHKCNMLAGLAVLSAVLYVIHMEANFNRE